MTGDKSARIEALRCEAAGYRACPVEGRTRPRRCSRIRWRLPTACRP